MDLPTKKAANPAICGFMEMEMFSQTPFCLRAKSARSVSLGQQLEHRTVALLVVGQFDRITLDAKEFTKLL